jgi:hypothetical protein
MIGHMRESLYYLIDGTLYKPSGMTQIIVIIFKDIITKDKILGFYIVTNNRIEDHQI